MKIPGKIPRFLRAFDQRKRRVYVNHIDSEHGLVQFYYFGFAKQSQVAATVSGHKASILHPSCREMKLDGGIFTHRHFFWLSVGESEDVRIWVGGIQRALRCRNVSLGYQTSCKVINDTYRWRHLEKSIAGLLAGVERVKQLARSPEVTRRFDRAWVLMDRDDKADDNAEHLYRYVRDRDPRRKIYYILRRDAADWERLKRQNFNMVEFGSDDHRLVLANASLLASSHLTKPMLYPFSKNKIAWKSLLKHKTVFLQHGTTLADNSRMFNNKAIDLFIVTTQAEYDSIAKADTNYVLSDKEVALTGFPRHDALLKLPSASRHVLVMPTWRRSLAGAATGDGLKRENIEGFHETAFCKNWSAFLNSDRLRQIAEQRSVEIVFAPHPNLIPYLKNLNLPSYVKVYDQFKDGALQQYFASSAVLVTDYSSVAFDVAYLLKPVVYFQFDAATIYKDHLPQGYFDFERDGFGPVCGTVEQTLESIEETLTGRTDPKYHAREETTFPLRDGKCCERIYLRMLDLVAEEAPTEIVKQSGCVLP